MFAWQLETNGPWYATETAIKRRRLEVEESVLVEQEGDEETEKLQEVGKRCGRLAGRGSWARVHLPFVNSGLMEAEGPGRRRVLPLRAKQTMGSLGCFVPSFHRRTSLDRGVPPTTALLVLLIPAGRARSGG